MAPPVHPGEILREEWMRPLGLTAAGLARALKLPRPRINDLVLERRSVTADTALRLACYFGTSAGLWLRLQAQYDLVVAERTSGKRVAMEVEPRDGGGREWCGRCSMRKFQRELAIGAIEREPGQIQDFSPDDTLYPIVARIEQQESASWQFIVAAQVQCHVCDILRCRFSGSMTNDLDGTIR